MPPTPVLVVCARAPASVPTSACSHAPVVAPWADPAAGAGVPVARTPADGPLPGARGAQPLRMIGRVGLESARAGIIRRVERRTDPQRLTQFVLDHPGRSAALSGALMLMLGLVIDLPAAIAAAVGGALAVIVWLIWRGNGPGYRWRQAMLRKFPKKDS